MNANAKRQLVFFGDDFFDFYNKQTLKVKLRIDWNLDVVRTLDHIQEKYFKHIETSDMYEVRISSGSNIYRVFCFFDKGKLIVVLNAFQKKT